MSSLEVLAFPNPFLRKEASPVTTFDEALLLLTDQMSITMHEHEGVGLAATQVGRDLQLLILSSYVFKSAEERKRLIDDPMGMGEEMVFINPEVIAQSDQEELDLEGCLSFPEVFIKVSRPIWVKVKAQDAHGEWFEIEGEGFGARAILHEMDHLNGKVMTDHLSYLARKKALNKHKRIQKSIMSEREEAREEARLRGEAVDLELGSSLSSAPSALEPAQAQRNVQDKNASSRRASLNKGKAKGKGKNKKSSKGHRSKR